KSYAIPAGLSPCQQSVVSHNLIIRPAGVAQSVERVALIYCISTTSTFHTLVHGESLGRGMLGVDDFTAGVVQVEKVAGSSPAFGYSYIHAVRFFFALSRCVKRMNERGG
ncbi:hypothetical protein KCU98_g8856, partial [Aureobasidium melanogenum]